MHVSRCNKISIFSVYLYIAYICTCTENDSPSQVFEGFDQDKESNACLPVEEFLATCIVSILLIIDNQSL